MEIKMRFPTFCSVIKHYRGDNTFEFLNSSMREIDFFYEICLK